LSASKGIEEEWRGYVARLVKALETGSEIHLDLLKQASGEPRDAVTAMLHDKRDLGYADANRLAVEEKRDAVFDAVVKAEDTLAQEESSLEQLTAANETLAIKHADVLEKAKTATADGKRVVAATAEMEEHARKIEAETEAVRDETVDANEELQQRANEVEILRSGGNVGAYRIATVLVEGLAHKGAMYKLDEVTDVERLALFGKEFVELTEGRADLEKAKRGLAMEIEQQEAEEAAALAEIAEIERITAEKTEELRQLNDRLKNFDLMETNKLLEFQVQISQAKEQAKIDLEAHRRVVQQEQIKVCAMQDEIVQSRRSRIDAEKSAMTQTDASIFIDQSTQKYVFPPITPAKSSQKPHLQTPAEAAFEAWASGEQELRPNALGKKKMKYLAEVYVPKALQHLDNPPSLNKTEPSLGKHLPPFVHPELHKTVIGMGKGQTKSKSRDIFLESA
jgi:hypothetical protein